MQEYQKKLLTLLKEIDVICRNNDITYYCSGGTVIGAARHGGFIPWDDDIDVCMMRADFERFCKVFKDDPPADRFLLYNENDPDYHSTIPRYVEAGSTSFCRYHQLGHVPAGVSIDIFILESVSDDPDKQREFIRKFFLYSDFVMPFYCFSHRVPDNDLDEFYRYMKLRDEKGESEVILALHNELFSSVSTEASNSNSVCLLWASSPSIFPKSIFADPAYLPFEDTEIPVPHDWCRYLYLEYGMNWMEVPFNDVQDGHISINRLDRSYEHCYAIRDRLYTAEDLLSAFYERKLATIEYEKAHRRLVEERSDIKVSAVNASVKNRLEDRGCSLKDLYDGGDIAAILDIFDDFLKLQLSKWFIGSRTRYHYYRYMYPQLADITEEDLSILTSSLIRAGRYSDLKKLLDAYVRRDNVSPAVSYAYDALLYIQKTESLYYLGYYDKCIAACDGCAYPELSAFADSFSLACRAMTEPEEVLDPLKEGASKDALLHKAFGDALYNTGDIASAEEVYRDVLETSRNGMFWKDICGKTSLTADAIYSEPKHKASRYALLYKMLLDEIVSVCDSNDIYYVLSPELSEAMLNHSIETGREKHLIYMTARDAARFISAFETARGKTPDPAVPAGRALTSWKNNGHISDFVLEYSRTDSVYLNFRSIEKTIEEGIGYTIRILRSGSAYSPGNLQMRLMEHQANNGLRSKAGLFDALMSRCSGNVKAGSDLYYFINKPNARPVRKIVSGKLFFDTRLIEVNGTSYRVPAGLADRSGNKEELPAKGKRALPENIFNLTDIGIGEFRTILNSSALDSIDMADHDRRAARLKSSESLVESIWDSIVTEEAKL